MHFRQAELSDIARMFSVRMSVKENVLVNTSLVTDEICATYITKRGRGWVCEMDGTITGFAIADLEDNSIWALFVQPEYEGMGIGKQLHNIMLSWYFAEGKEDVWLTTAQGTRAEIFYKQAGWADKGIKNGEVRFELTASQWNNKGAKL